MDLPLFEGSLLKLHLFWQSEIGKHSEGCDFSRRIGLVKWDLYILKVECDILVYGSGGPVNPQIPGPPGHHSVMVHEPFVEKVNGSVLIRRNEWKWMEDNQMQRSDTPP